MSISGWVPRASLVLLVFLAIGFQPRAATAQAKVRITSDQEDFRKDPNGRVLGTVLRGNEFAVVAEQGDWAQLELDGWIWAASVGGTNRDGYDLVVQADGGENLRVRPQGTIIARLREGFLLTRVGASGSWIHVKRSGWVSKSSIARSGSLNNPARPASAGTNGASDEPLEPTILTAPTALVVHATPDGDTLAIFQPGAQAQALGRTGDWVHVRVDGWVYGPAVLDSAINLEDTGNLSPARLRSDPARYKGALIRWRVQFIGLRHAEPARSDLGDGEPYLLARGPAGDAGFVYLAVPEELMSVAERLEPLSYITVVGRVRTGRSALVGAPVIGLTEIEPQVAPR